MRKPKLELDSFVLSLLHSWRYFVDVSKRLEVDLLGVGRRLEYEGVSVRLYVVFQSLITSVYCGAPASLCSL